jgi:hypothetical protein
MESDIDGQLYEGNPNTNLESEININLVRVAQNFI